MASTVSTGKVWSRSQASAWGAISASAKSRTTLRKASCSSLKSSSIGPPYAPRMAQPGPVTLREVGPRDGLQAEAPVAVADRVALIEALLDAGVRHIELVSFVSPKAVPSMDGAAEVVRLVGRSPGRGAHRAGAQPARGRAGPGRRGRRAHGHGLGVGGLQPPQRPDVGRGVDRRRRRISALAATPACRSTPWCRAPSGRPTRATSRRVTWRPSAAVSSMAAPPASPSPTPRAWRRPAGSTRCSTSPASTSASTSTRPGPRVW